MKYQAVILGKSRLVRYPGNIDKHDCKAIALVPVAVSGGYHTVGQWQADFTEDVADYRPYTEDIGRQALQRRQALIGGAKANPSGILHRNIEAVQRRMEDTIQAFLHQGYTLVYTR